MTKKAVLINDLSGLGKCSLVASIGVLSVMGVQPCPMPTAILTNQTGYPDYYCKDFTEDMNNYSNMWQKLNFEPDGIYTGFLSNEKQVDVILDFAEKFKHHKTLIMVDPVMGDNGIKYDMFTETLSNKMKKLVSCADIITPNLTECCILCDEDYNEITNHSNKKDYLKIIEKLGKKLLRLYNVKTVVITGIIQVIDNTPYICNLAITKNETFETKSRFIGQSYSGTGDLFASVIFAGLLKNIDLKTIVNKAVAFIEKSIEDTVHLGIDRNHGIEYEKNLNMLL